MIRPSPNLHRLGETSSIPRFVSLLRAAKNSHGPIVVPKKYLYAIPLGDPPLGKNWPGASQKISISYAAPRIVGKRIVHTQYMRV